MVVSEMTGRGSSCIVCKMGLFPCQYKAIELRGKF
nr:MAG TPA: conotoxin [Caudoviricetes sp.]